MLLKIKVDNVLMLAFGARFKVLDIDIFNNTVSVLSINTNINYKWNLYRGNCIDVPSSWQIERNEKVIPDYPLDPALHVLEAGYIQDRQRKSNRNKQ